MDDLQHVRDHCVGAWSLESLAGFRVWRCTLCHAAFVDSPATAMAASRDKLLKHLLATLEQEGRALLRAARGPRNR